jgi:hypothetical protein
LQVSGLGWCKRLTALQVTGVAGQTPPGARSKGELRFPARAFEGGPSELVGRPLEAVSNGSCRWMAAGPRERVHRTRPTGQLARRLLELDVVTQLSAQIELSWGSDPHPRLRTAGAGRLGAALEAGRSRPVVVAVDLVCCCPSVHGLGSGGFVFEGCEEWVVPRSDQVALNCSPQALGSVPHLSPGPWGRMSESAPRCKPTPEQQDRCAGLS